jgi:hypothetical protein
VSFGALLRLGTDVLRRRPLIGSPPALERLFIASTVGSRHRSPTEVQAESGLFVFVNKPLGRQLLQQRLRFLQITRVKALREPPVNRSEQFARFAHLALVAPEAREAHGAAEFPGFGLLLASD